MNRATRASTKSRNVIKETEANYQKHGSKQQPTDAVSDTQSHELITAQGAPRPILATSLLETVQKIVGLTAGIAGVAYFIGFIIISIHLARYGVYGTSLINTRYITAGLLYFMFLLMPIVGILRFAAFRSIVGIVFATLIFPATVYTTILILGYIRPVSIGQFIGSIFFWLFTATLIPIMETLTTYQRGETPSFPIARYISPVAFMAILFGIFVYAREIYPYVSPAIGGGQPIKVILVAKEEKSNTLSKLVPMEDKLTTRPLLLADQNSSFYVVVVTTNTGTQDYKSIVLDNELIDGIIFADQSIIAPEQPAIPIATPFPITPTTNATPLITALPAQP